MIWIKKFYGKWLWYVIMVDWMAGMLDERGREYFFSGFLFCYRKKLSPLLVPLPKRTTRAFYIPHLGLVVVDFFKKKVIYRYRDIYRVTTYHTHTHTDS